jgi:hypothetical protein
VRRRTATASVLLVVALAACSSGQDPGLDESPSGSTASTDPPQLLEPCPPGGPDASTPAAGCVDDDGNVVH